MEDVAEDNPEAGPAARRVPPVLVACGVVALVPVVRMARWVLEGSRVQYGDYFWIFDQTVGPNGRPTIEGIFALYNNHMMAVPKVVYWVNVQVSGGSNIVLGLAVIAMALVQIALLATRAPAMPTPSCSGSG